MPSFVTVTTGVTAQAQDVNQVIAALNGTAGSGIPISLTALNDSVNFALAVKNADPTNSRSLQILKSNNNVLIQADANGVIVSPDGGASTAQVVNTTLAQTLSNKTLASPIFSPVLNQRARAVGAAGGPTTASATYVDLTDLAVTLTTTGGDLLCWAVCDFSNSLAGAYDYLALSLDAAVEVGEQIHNMTTANAIYSLSCVWLFTGVSAAAHTVKTRWHVDSGTGTANGTRRQMVVVEIKG